MKRQNTTFIDIREVSSIEDVVSSLELIDSQHGALGLAQFALFNQAYLVVTRSIQQAIKSDYFENPSFIEQFIVNFAGYYFAACNKSLNRDPSLSVPWAKLNDYAANKSSPVFISLMLGANAHINSDLPQVLKKLLQEEKAKYLLGDIAKIDRILMKSGNEIISLFSEKNHFLDFLKRRFQFMYYRPAMYTILYWRIRAWRNYQKLIKSDNATQRITNRSIKIANRLLTVANILG